MKKYCLDTSGFSNPMEDKPQDIYVSLWARVMAVIDAGILAVTKEIYEELTHIPGQLGDHIKANESLMLLEVGDDSWDWLAYVGNAKRMQVDYTAFISEHNGGTKGTIGLNDLSIVALGKSLSLPVISMERAKAHNPTMKRGIPDICSLEKVPHITFNDFLRAEGIKL